MAMKLMIFVILAALPGYISSMPAFVPDFGDPGLVVDNIPHWANEDTVFEEFSKFGNLYNFEFTRGTPESLGSYAFMEYDFPEDATRAVETLNGTYLWGKQRCDRMIMIRTPQADPLTRPPFNETVVVEIIRNYAGESYTANDVKEFFNKYGKILKFDWFVSGVAIITFEGGYSENRGGTDYRGGAQWVICSLNEVEWKGHILKVKWDDSGVQKPKPKPVEFDEPVAVTIWRLPEGEDFNEMDVYEEFNKHGKILKFDWYNLSDTAIITYQKGFSNSERTRGDSKFVILMWNEGKGTWKGNNVHIRRAHHDPTAPKPAADDEELDGFVVWQIPPWADADYVRNVFSRFGNIIKFEFTRGSPRTYGSHALIQFKSDYDAFWAMETFQSGGRFTDPDGNTVKRCDTRLKITQSNGGLLPMNIGE